LGEIFDEQKALSAVCAEVALASKAFILYTPKPKQYRITKFTMPAILNRFFTAQKYNFLSNG
jgi:hypothetical protein